MISAVEASRQRDANALRLLRQAAVDDSGSGPQEIMQIVQKLEARTGRNAQR